MKKKYFVNFCLFILFSSFQLFLTILQFIQFIILIFSMNYPRSLLVHSLQSVSMCNWEKLVEIFLFIIIFKQNSVSIVKNINPFEHLNNYFFTYNLFHFISYYNYISSQSILSHLQIPFFQSREFPQTQNKKWWKSKTTDLHIDKTTVDDENMTNEK